MSDPVDRELAVFSAVRRLPVEGRAAYLDEACAGDAALRQRVEELLRASKEAGEFLEDPAHGAQRPENASGSPTLLMNLTAPGEKAGDRIGRYKLLQQIGEGGCGVVYMAEQEEPVRRRVALKVIKLGMDTKSVIARFEAERQALALMDHPNIAKVLEAGATDAGRPYFVMELVRGVKITEYCDQNNLSTKERLELFIHVCHAVQHAHQKGIIHRDIKPSNILVASNDGAPVPKVIDFGIAKATQGRLTDQTLFTAFEQFIGTPAYMSPEQAELTMFDVDTRTDIYSLGVLLYELLIGRTPFDTNDLLAAGLDAMRRTIREQEPERPSTRLSTMAADALTTTAKHRHTEAPRLLHLIRGDLDWIVMKALEKDRARRYETANGLASDVQRHLNCEPVIARPPSRLYEFQKTVRRHKFGFAAATAVAAALLLGLGISTWMFFQERTAREIAVAAEQEQARLRRQAETEAAEGRRVATFLVDIGEALRQQGSLVASESTYRESLAMCKRLLPKEHPMTDWALIGLSYVLENEGKFSEAENLTREALASARKFSTNDPVRVEVLVAALANALRFQSNYVEAEFLNREALASARQFATNDPAKLELRIRDVADILRRQKKYAEAEPFFREALASARQFATNDPRHLQSRLNDLAGVLQHQGKLAEAEAIRHEAELLIVGRPATMSDEPKQP